jgi:hypothetical protein
MPEAVAARVCRRVKVKVRRTAVLSSAKERMLPTVRAATGRRTREGDAVRVCRRARAGEQSTGPGSAVPVWKGMPDPVLKNSRADAARESPLVRV